jgi:hypothetical protein
MNETKRPPVRTREPFRRQAVIRFELDADFAEALHVLDFPTRGLDVRAMVADTRASLHQVPATRERFLAGLAPRANAPLERWIATIRPGLTREDARPPSRTRDPGLR